MTLRTRSANIGGAVITSTGITLSTGTDLSTQANDAYLQANTARDTANAAYGAANTAETNALAAYGQANDAYSQANTARSDANATFAVVNTTFGTVNTAITNAHNQANSAYSQANLAYEAANNSNLKLGGLVTGTINVTQDLIVGGNIYLEGNTTYINVATYSVEDSLIYLASNNDLTDSVDIGFMGGKNTSGTYSHTGFARDATDGKWKLFDGLAEEGHVGNVVDFANTYLATLVANVEANTLSVVNGVSGNVNFDSGTLFVDSLNNRVGVGTSSPISPFNIESDSNIRAVIRNSTENTSYSCSWDFMTGNGSFGSTNVTGRIISLITQADPNPLKSAITFHTNRGDNLGERMRIDADGNVGIGTTSPVAKLNVEAAANTGAIIALAGNANGFYPSAIFGGSIGYNFSGGGAEVDFWNNWTGASSTQGGFIFRKQTGASSQTPLMLIRGDGNVGIGTLNPSYKLHVDGDIYATGNVTAYSDGRKKINVNIIENAVSKVQAIRGVTYNKIDEPDTKYTGVIAQEVLEVLPEAVTGNSEIGYAVAYGNMVGLLIEAIKELKAEIEVLKQK